MTTRANRETALHPTWKRGGAPRPLALGLALATTCPVVAAAPDPELTAPSLQPLLDVTNVGAPHDEPKKGEVAAGVNAILLQEAMVSGRHTLDEALTPLAGVHTTNDRQDTYSDTRRFALPGDLKARMQRTINGNRVSDATFGRGHFGGEVPLERDLVERIEFIPGPGRIDEAHTFFEPVQAEHERARLPRCGPLTEAA